MGQVEVPMGPTLLVIASRFRPVWRRPCTRWRSAPGRASTDGARAHRRLPLAVSGKRFHTHSRSNKKDPAAPRATAAPVTNPVGACTEQVPAI